MIVMRIVLSVIARLQLVEADAAVLLHRQVGDAVAVLLEPLAGVDDRLVLGDRGDDVVALLAVHLGDALDREVVGLGRAAREDDFLRVRADEIGDLLARLLDRLFGFPAERMVAAGGVAEVLGEIRQHRLDDARIDRRRRVIVHVDRKLDCHRFLSGGLKAALPRFASCLRPCRRRAITNACAAPRRAPAPATADPPPARRSCTRRAPPESARAPATADRARCTSRTARTCPSSVEQAVTVTGPSIAWMTSATEICAGARAS